MSVKKKIYQFLLFVVIMSLTFYAVFQNQDFSDICDSITQMTMCSIIVAMSSGLLFVCIEGVIIWYLLSATGNKSSVWRCIQYSFIGFFYSGITPSATGGQPMQLYYMKKDGNKASDSSVILMTVAVAYKLVLVLIGVFLLSLWYQSLKASMGEYIILFYVGIILNLAVILVIICAMAFPNILVKTIYLFEKGMIRLRILNANNERRAKIQHFIDGYGQTVDFMIGHKSKLVVVVILTAIQRCSTLLMTYIVYRGFHLTGNNVFKILALQAAICIAVEMLPVPGAQGITELVYQTVFFNVFPNIYLIPSMLVIRGMGFYFILLISSIITGWTVLRSKNTVSRNIT